MPMWVSTACFLEGRPNAATSSLALAAVALLEDSLSVRRQVESAEGPAAYDFHQRARQARLLPDKGQLSLPGIGS